MISSEAGTSLENTTLSTLDFDRRVISPKDVDTIIDGHGRKDAINARSLHLKVQWLSWDSEYERELLRERIARLSGG
ncbi:MAG: hypothetical protein ACTS46_00650 [Candidatus Hodgkinia cicadicola]